MVSVNSVTSNKFFLPIAAAAATAVLLGISIRIWSKWSSVAEQDKKNDDSSDDDEDGGELLTFEEFILAENEKTDSTELSFKEFMQKEKKRESLARRSQRVD